MMSETLIDRPMDDSGYIQKCSHCPRVLVAKESKELGSCVSCRGKFTDTKDISIAEQLVSEWSYDNRDAR